MGAGRPPVPTAIKVLQGTDQKCRVNKNEPQPKLTASPEPPDTLSKDAKVQYKAYWEVLEDARMVTEVDTVALSLMASATAEYYEAARMCEKFGNVVKGPNGLPKISEFYKIKEKAESRMLAYLREFGMTPSSRTRVSRSDAGEPEDEWALLKNLRQA